MTRIRPTWPDLPLFLREAIQEAAGGRVMSWTSHDGGYSPGWALSLQLANDAVFIKVASSEHPISAKFHRNEALRAAVLPDSVPAPRFRWSREISDPDGERSWVVVASDVVRGRAVRSEPWDLHDVDRLAHLAHAIAEHTTHDTTFKDSAEKPWPQPGMLADQLPSGLNTYDPWFAKNLDWLVQLASPERQYEAFSGHHLQHGDLRADNALIVARQGVEEAVAIDWPHAERGPAFRDHAAMLPSIAATGGPAPADALARVPFFQGTDSEAVTVWVAVMTCYFVWSSLQDPPEGIPHLRAFQRAQGEAALAWLRERVENVSAYR